MLEQPDRSPFSVARLVILGRGKPWAAQDAGAEFPSEAEEGTLRTSTVNTVNGKQKTENRLLIHPRWECSVDLDRFAIDVCLEDRGVVHITCTGSGWVDTENR